MFDNRLYGLAFGCPFLERDDNCPLKGIDHLSIKEKVDWLNRQNNEQQKRIVEKHKNCSKNRV